MPSGHKARRALRELSPTHQSSTSSFRAGAGGFMSTARHPRRRASRTAAAACRPRRPGTPATSRARLCSPAAATRRTRTSCRRPPCTCRSPSWRGGQQGRRRGVVLVPGPYAKLRRFHRLGLVIAGLVVLLGQCGCDAAARRARVGLDRLLEEVHHEARRPCRLLRGRRVRCRCRGSRSRRCRARRRGRALPQALVLGLERRDLVSQSPYHHIASSIIVLLLVLLEHCRDSGGQRVGSAARLVCRALRHCRLGGGLRRRCGATANSRPDRRSESTGCQSSELGTALPTVVLPSHLAKCCLLLAERVARAQLTPHMTADVHVACKQPLEHRHNRMVSRVGGETHPEVQEPTCTCFVV